MRLLLDTQLLIWAGGASSDGSGRLSPRAVALIRDLENELLFSTATLWEIAIKRSLGRSDFLLEPRSFRRRAVESGYVELAIDAEHCLAVADLPLLHRDPFDRLLIAQAIFEGVTLLTADAKVAAYPGPILLV